jgi:hypothetical protein
VRSGHIAHAVAVSPVASRNFILQSVVCAKKGSSERRSRLPNGRNHTSRPCAGRRQRSPELQLMAPRDAGKASPGARSPVQAAAGRTAFAGLKVRAGEELPVLG